MVLLSFFYSKKSPQKVSQPHFGLFWSWPKTRKCPKSAFLPKNGGFGPLFLLFLDQKLERQDTKNNWFKEAAWASKFLAFWQKLFFNSIAMQMIFVLQFYQKILVTVRQQLQSLFDRIVVFFYSHITAPQQREFYYTYCAHLLCWVSVCSELSVLKYYEFVNITK